MNKNLTIIIIVSFIVVAIAIFADNARVNNNTIKEQEIKIEKQIDSINYLNNKLQDITIELNTAKSALNTSDSLKYENFVLKYKIERIKQYDSIVARNSSQSKYFRGWVRRVIYN